MAERPAKSRQWRRMSDVEKAFYIGIAKKEDDDINKVANLDFEELLASPVSAYCHAIQLLE